VWFPKYVPSLITSLHHNDIDEIRDTKANAKKFSALEKPCIVNTPHVVKVNKLKDENIGQGEGDTKWKG